MGADTKIEWATHSWNPWEGCTKVSPGCANCYAEARNARFGGGTAPNWGSGKPRRRTSAANWLEPLKWDRAAAWEERDAEACGRAAPRRPRVFCASLADWLDDEVPVEWLADLLGLIWEAPHLDWLLLTKRPENWRTRISAVADFGCAPAAQPDYWTMARGWLDGRAPENVWIGTTVEDQNRAEQRIPELVEIPARVRFLSCEPLLERVDLGYWLGESVVPQVDWVICGGESGRGARPMDARWAREIRDECAAAGVPFLFKQWGAHDQNGNRWPKSAWHRRLDGVEHTAFPHPKP